MKPIQVKQLIAGLAALSALVIGATVMSPIAAGPAAAAPQTVVSLTFDDGDANQLSVVPEMNRLGMKGTFYVTSGWVGAPSYFTRANLTSLASAGHEIGGHSVNHPDLATIPADEVARQVCNDRATLTSWGHAVRSFAYPFASSTPAVETIVKNCGYNSARMLGDIRSRFGCGGCSYAETIPPRNPFYTRALDQVESTWTLNDLKAAVTNAEKTGGWVQLTFHKMCDSGCGSPSMKPALFKSFINWLSLRASTKNTVVKTVGDVIGGAVKPVVNGPVVAGLAPGVNGIVNPGLETAGTGGFPKCFMQAGYGTNTASYTFPSGRTSAKAGKVSVANYASGDAKLLPVFDGGSCAPTVTPGRTYSLRAWYSSTSVTQFAVYLRTTSGVWQYWTSSPWLAASSTYTQAAFTTPAIPSGFTGISFGLNIFANGSITTDDYALYDSAGAPPLSSTALVARTSPAPPPGVEGPVEVFMDAPNEGTQ